MPNGAEVKAFFPDGVAVQAGDTIDLTVFNKDVSPIHLKLAAVNGQTVNLESNELQIFLMDMGIQPTRINQSAANLLIRYHINPTPERMAALLEVAAAFPELPESIAVFMAANHIAVTEENVRALTEWAASPPELGSHIDQLANLLRDELGKSGFSEQFQQIFLQEKGTGKFREMFTGKQFQELSVKLAESSMDISNAKILIRDFLEPLPASPQEKQYLEVLMVNSFLNAKRAVEGLEQTAGEKEGIPSRGAAENGVKEIPVQNVNGVDAPTAQEVRGEIQATGKAHDLSASGGAENFSKENRDLSILLQAVSRFFVSVHHSALPDDAAGIREAVKNQAALAEQVRGSIAGILDGSSPARQKADAIAAQTQLANRIEQFYYCQIPFENNGQKNTAELYVLKRKPGRQIEEKEQVTILIGLDTEYMGRIETVLHSTEGKLSVEFRVENNKIKRLFLDSVQEFRKMLQDNRFDTGDITVRTIDKPTTPFNVLEHLEAKNEAETVTGIDIRI